MGYKLIRQEDFNTYTIKHFQCDADSDRATIISDYSSVTGKNALHAGWTATVTANDSTVSFVLGNDLSSWTEIAFSKGGDPGSGYFPLIASTESVMTTDGGGDPATIPYSTEDDADTMMLRDAEGKAQVATPVASDDEKTAANKEYVGLVANEFEDGTRVAKHAEIADEANSLATTLGVTDETPTAMQPVGGTSDVTTTYQKLNKLVGCKVVKNQLVQNGNFVDDSGWSFNAATHSVASNTLSVTATAQYGNAVKSNLNLVNGHKYLLTFLHKGTTGGFSIYTNTSEYFGDVLTNATDSSFAFKGAIVSYTKTSGTATLIFQDNRSSDWTEQQFKSVCLHDLTLRYGNSDVVNAIIGNDSSKYVEKLLAFDPNILVDTAYDTGSFSSCKSATLRTVDYNQWDEQTQLGAYNTATGVFIPDTTHLACKNKIRVLGAKAYYFYTNGYNANVCFLDENDNLLLNDFQVNNSTITAPLNAKFVVFNLAQAYGTTYNHDICIFLYWDGSRIGYEPYSAHDYTLPNKDLNGILTVKNGKVVAIGDELYPSGEGDETRYAEVDLGTLGWVFDTTSYVVPVFYATISGKKAGNVLCTKYANKAGSSWGALSNGEVNGGYLNFVAICDTTYDTAASFKTAMSGVKLIYELATPTALTAPTFPSTFYGDDFGTMWFLDEDGNVINGLQGNEIFYKANVAGFAESLYGYTEGDATSLVRWSDMATQSEIDEILDLI